MRRSTAPLFLAAAIALSACGGGDSSPPPAPAPAGPFSVSLLAGSLKQPGAQDGRGEAAGFNNPQYVAADAAGNLYVSDTGNHTIRKIAPDGTVSTLAGSPGQAGASDGTGAAARFSYPQGIAVDAAGNLFVADTGNQTVRRVSPAGLVTTFAGQTGQYGSVDGAREVARMAWPREIALAADGELLVGGDDYAVRKIAADGSIRTFAGHLGDPAYVGPDAIGTVTGIAVDGAGNVFLTTGLGFSATLRKYSPSGQPLPFPGGASSIMLPFTADIAADAQGNVYVASGGSFAPVPNPASHSIFNSIHRLGTDGVLQRLVGVDLLPGSLDGPAAQALLDRPMGIAIAPGGRIVFADNGNHAIRELGVDGVVRTIAGGAGLGHIDAQGAAARFSGPGPMAAFGGHLYVADQRIPSALRRVAADGTVTTATLVDEATGAPIPFIGTRLAEAKIVQDVAATATRLFVALRTYGSGSFGTVWSCNEALRCRAVYEGTAASITADPDGNLYAVGSGVVRRIAPDGTQSDFLTGLQAVSRMRADARGIVLAQPQAHVVQRYGFDGRLVLEAGRVGEPGDADGSAAQARFNTPWTLALDPDGNIYVVDDSKRVRRIASDGSVVTVATLPAAYGGLAWLGDALYATVLNAVLRLSPAR